MTVLAQPSIKAAESLRRAASLSCWSVPVTPEPLPGGLTNRNYRVVHRGEKFVVRIADDIPIHHVMRFNELTASKAAAAAGLSPAVVHHELGALVLRFVEGKTLGPGDIQARAMLARIAPLIRRCHREVQRHLRGPALIFWPFHLLRDYAATLREGDSRFLPEVPRLMAALDELETAVGPVEIVFCHNDLLAANFIDDGERLWLIDWDYAGFNTPLFDLANLCSSNEVAAVDQDWLLEAYFGRPPSAELRRRFHAMKCVSLLREAMWGMVSALSPALEIDFVAYANQYLARFDRTFAARERN
jgi:thiamine kinase-like enzyme